MCITIQIKIDVQPSAENYPESDLSPCQASGHNNMQLGSPLNME